MGIFANAYFDVAAVSQGIVFLLFCIPIVLLVEVEVYRIFCPNQGLMRAIVTSIYANSVSGILGIFCAETMEDVVVRMVGSTGFIYEACLFFFLFLLTYLLEFFAIYLIRKKLKVQKVFIVVGIANLASYAMLAIMIVLFEFMKGL